MAETCIIIAIGGAITTRFGHVVRWDTGNQPRNLSFSSPRGRLHYPTDFAVPASPVAIDVLTDYLDHP